MNKTQVAVQSALRAIGNVLAELVQAVDADARESTRQAVLDAFPHPSKPRPVKVAKLAKPAPHANGVKPKTKPTKAGKPFTATKAGARRSSEEITVQAAKLFEHINAHPGVSAEGISNALGIPTKVLPAPLKVLIKEKKIKASGVARGTTYTAV